MLCLRVARGSRPSALLRRLALAAASAGAGVLLLCALGYALGTPAESSVAIMRLLWCLVPAAAAIHLAVAVARGEPFHELTAGLIATGYSTSRIARLAAASIGITCVLGSVVALLVFLHLRGDVGSSPLPPPSAKAVGAGVSLPIAGTITLLAVVPLLSAGATALALRPWRRNPAPRARAEETSVPGVLVTGGGLPLGLPWGAALISAGLVLELYAQRWQPSRPDDRVPLPGGLPELSSAMIAGWSLTAAGLVLAGPGLVHLCGRVLATARPGALRLLAGRGLQAEAARLGRPLGVLCVTASAALTSARLFATSGEVRLGPLTLLGACLVVACAVATVLVTADEARNARGPVTETLTRIGASTILLRKAALVRAGALLVLLTPLTWMVAELAALPMYF